MEELLNIRDVSDLLKIRESTLRVIAPVRK
jgi:hypothetical protein